MGDGEGWRQDAAATVGTCGSGGFRQDGGRMNQEECREEARQRVLKEAREKTGRLDLVGLGELDRLPEEIGSLGHLKELWIWGTEIEDLTPISGLKELRVLDCSISEIVDLTPIAGLRMLRELYCSATEISDLGPLLNLSSLQRLHCYHTRVADLTPLAGLSSLGSLDCSNCEVFDLAPLAGLSALSGLRCSGNQVSDLTPLVGLEELRTLWLGHLDLPDFPRELLQPGRLESLYLEGGSIEGVPGEILNQGNCLEDLRSHYRDLEEGDELLPDVKVMVLGNGRIGKTHSSRP